MFCLVIFLDGLYNLYIIAIELSFSKFDLIIRILKVSTIFSYDKGFHETLYFWFNANITFNFEKLYE